MIDVPVTFQKAMDNVHSSEWLVTLLLPETANRDAVMKRMAEFHVDTRPSFYCAHHLPMYIENGNYPISENVAARGLSLPSYPGLSEFQIDQVVHALISGLAT